MYIKPFTPTSSPANVSIKHQVLPQVTIKFGQSNEDKKPIVEYKSSGCLLELFRMVQGFFSSIVSALKKWFTKKADRTKQPELNLLLATPQELWPTESQQKVRMETLRHEIANLTIPLFKALESTKASEGYIDHFAEYKYVPLPEGIQLPQLKEGITPITLPSFESILSLGGEQIISIPTLQGRRLNVDYQQDALMDENNPKIQAKLGKLKETDFLLTYGVKWDKTKCIRDLLQNFYDAHGQTLEGVTIKVSRDTPAKPYTVRIEGLAEYNHELVEKVGGTTKKGLTHTAGGFGEGLKILSLVLLRDHAVDAITSSSRNWAIHFSKGKSSSNRPVLCRQLDLVSDRPGNYVEIATKDPNLVMEILNGINLFKQPYNPDFSSPLFEDKISGFQYEGMGKKGNYYAIGQRYEVEQRADLPNTWHQGVEFFSVWESDKPKIDRDRTAISIQHVSNCFDRVKIKEDGDYINQWDISDEEVLKLIFHLEDTWDNDKMTAIFKKWYPQAVFEDKESLIDPTRIRTSEERQESALYDFLAYFTPPRRLLESLISCRYIRTDMPDQYVAVNARDKKEADLAHQLNKIPAFYLLHFLGLPTVEKYEPQKALTGQTDKSKFHVPTQAQVQKMKTLYKAAQLICQSINILPPESMNPQIAFRKSDTSQFDYITSGRLKDDLIILNTEILKCPFEVALVNYLYHLGSHGFNLTPHSHPRDFGYRLTKWIELYTKVMLENPSLRNTLLDLKTLWEESK
jgi:hypothetical protein